ATYGCKKDYLDLSYSALHALTQRFSAEDAIRYFINAFPEPTLSRLELWCHDPHYHVRRLCSEGTRPKLPWAQKIHIPPDAPIHLLDLLHADPTRYVTRSVANHLNDMGKLNPDLVLEVLKRWSLAGKQSSQEMEFMARHALRSLVKTGNPQALDWLGFKIGTPCQVNKLCVPKRIQMNHPFEFSFEVLCPNHLLVMIDYIVYFQNKNGKMTNKKVLKLCQVPLKSNQPVAVRKKHCFRHPMSTRVLYPGRHAIHIQVNGTVCAQAEFDLTY
ncbi:MAG: DNA alkylation repair protein, partial [Gammaproteobacteria bacterium]|nr:DNA alkylation repair protein [Gammaproteobacteria bacterium]